MFIGRPPGNYDRLLDFSRAVTGNLYFVPSATFLESVAEDQPAAGVPSADPTVGEPAQSVPRQHDGSLDIGSLKGEISHE
jgi:putative iron-dependent peroxidase